MKNNTCREYNLGEIKNNLNEIGKYIAGFIGSIAGYYLGQAVAAKITGNSRDIKEFKDTISNGKVIVQENSDIMNKLQEAVENDELETINDLEEITGVKLF